MTRSILVILLLTTFGTSAFAGDPKRAAVHNKQAKAYFDAKQFDDAIFEFNKSYDLDPKPLTLYKIASAYYAKGDYKRAIDYYQKYLTEDPDGTFAAQAIEFSTIANKALADETAKQRAATEAARVEADRKAAAVETERKRVAATAKIKQAEAYAKANAWASAGKEYLAAEKIDGDPTHLLAAAEAFHKVPDDVSSRDALLAYLGKVPVGDKSDQIRVQVADLTRAIENAAAEERRQKEALAKANAGNEAANKGAMVLPGGMVLPAYMTSMVASAGVTSPPRRISFGFDLRGGIYGPGDYTDPDGVTVANKAGPTAGVGAFIVFPLWTQSHVQLGVRAWYFKSSYSECTGSTPMMCPTSVSAPFVGPAATLKASAYDQGRLDVYAILGFSFDVALRGAGRISFSAGGPQDEHMSIEKQAQAEIGVGVRFSPVSIDAVFQTSLNEFSEGLSVGKANGILFAAGWSLPR